MGSNRSFASMCDLCQQAVNGCIERKDTPCDTQFLHQSHHRDLIALEQSANNGCDVCALFCSSGRKISKRRPGGINPGLEVLLSPDTLVSGDIQVSFQLLVPVDASKVRISPFEYFRSGLWFRENSQGQCHMIIPDQWTCSNDLHSKNFQLKRLAKYQRWTSSS
jgi:hypothetical protein